MSVCNGCRNQDKKGVDSSILGLYVLYAMQPGEKSHAEEKKKEKEKEKAESIEFLIIIHPCLAFEPDESPILFIPR